MIARNKILLFLTVVMLWLPRLATAQSDSVADSKLTPHFSLGTGVFSWNGDVRPYTSVGAQFDYKLNDKWTIGAGFQVYNEWNRSGYELRGHQPRSLAPVKRNTSLISLNANVRYKVNPRLDLALSLFHVGGQLNPVWPHMSERYVDVTGIDAAMRYRIGEDSYLHIHFSYYRDSNGALGAMGYPYLWGYGWNSPFYFNNHYNANCLGFAPMYCY